MRRRKTKTHRNSTETAEDTFLTQSERALSGLVGGALIKYAMRRTSTLGAMIAAIAGGTLLYRGATGQCGLYKKLGVEQSQTT